MSPLFCRQLIVLHYISQSESITKICEKLKESRSSVHRIIQSYGLLGVQCNFSGSKKTGSYSIQDWGPIDPDWVYMNIEIIEDRLRQHKGILR